MRLSKALLVEIENKSGFMASLQIADRIFIDNKNRGRAGYHDYNNYNAEDREMEDSCVICERK